MHPATLFLTYTLSQLVPLFVDATRPNNVSGNDLFLCCTCYVIWKVDACHPMKSALSSTAAAASQSRKRSRISAFTTTAFWVGIYLTNLVFCSFESPGWRHPGRSMGFRIRIGKAIGRCPRRGSHKVYFKKTRCRRRLSKVLFHSRWILAHGSPSI